jgi:hypothetical protein
MNRVRLAAALLGVACVVWTAVPWRGTGLAATVMVVASFCVVMSSLRLLIGWLPRPEHEFLASAPMRAWLWFHDAMRTPPWEELAVVGIVWLEALHPSHPWHTAILGLILIAYLLAAHLAESGSPVRALRPQTRALLLGVCLLAAAAGVGMISPATGSSGALLRVIAALAAILAAALVLPT